MSMLVKILKSDDFETEQRQIARIKKEIDYLTEDLQIREEKAMKLKNKNRK